MLAMLYLGNRWLGVGLCVCVCRGGVKDKVANSELRDIRKLFEKGKREDE